MYKMFNNVASDMLSDIADRFPRNKEMAACVAFHKMASVANVRLPYERFLEYAIIPYGDRLKAHDDAFFMETTYDDAAGDSGARFIDALKGLWAEMTEDDRQSVHQYLDLLLSIHCKISES